MHSLSCRRVLYPYETRILFILVGDDQVDKAQEIAELLKESDVAIDRLYTTPETHRLGSAFWQSLRPDEPEDERRICDIGTDDEQIGSMLEEKALRQSCDRSPELLQLIPSEVRGSSGCHTYALAPARHTKIRDAENTAPHIGEYIIDQRSGLTQLHWLM
jgi:hypothetical protein